MHSTPKFLQGVFEFEGHGLEKHQLIDPALSYTVPFGSQGQVVYFRGGNSAPEMVCVLLVRDGVPMRYFPIAAKGDVHVPLRVVEDLDGGSRIELHISAPAALVGTVVIDLGLVEV